MPHAAITKLGSALSLLLLLLPHKVIGNIRAKIHNDTFPIRRGQFAQQSNIYIHYTSVWTWLGCARLRSLSQVDIVLHIFPLLFCRRFDVFRGAQHTHTQNMLAVPSIVFNSIFNGAIDRSFISKRLVLRNRAIRHENRPDLTDNIDRCANLVAFFYGGGRESEKIPIKWSFQLFSILSSGQVNEFGVYPNLWLCKLNYDYGRLCVVRVWRGCLMRQSGPNWILL